MSLYSAAKVLKDDQVAGFWNATISKNSGYKEDSLALTSKEMIRYVQNYHLRREESTICSLIKKYQQEKYLSVVKIMDDYMERHGVFK